MITRITGRIVQVAENRVSLSVGPFEYEVLIPEFVRRQLQGQMNEEVKLFTIEYLEGNAMQGHMTPRLIGFLSVVEREFFEMITSVDGVGVKKALRAMVRPVREVAEAIEQQDLKSLSMLPGVGQATAERMVAKLRRKVPKFALMISPAEGPLHEVERDVVAEAFEVLQAVGHAPTDARKLLDSALAGKKKFKDVQELLQAVYQQSHGS